MKGAETDNGAKELHDKAWGLYLENRYPQAKKVLIKNIASYPNFAASHLLLGQIYFFSSNADYDAAAKEFLEVVKSEPSWTEGYQWLGSALKQLGDLDAAMAAYRKAIRLAPEDSRPHVDLGVCLTEKKRYTQAIKMLKRGLDLKPYCTEADIRVFLAEALLKSGNIAGACAEWRLVLKIEPGYPSYGQPQKEAERLLEKYEKAT